jgi:hypothetical protein
MAQRELNEEKILSCCALRFDGYTYAAEHDFKPDEFISAFLQTGQWQGNEAQCLSAFFYLQRALFKWSLVYEPEHSPYWRAFRELFLRLYNAEIPRQYRMADYYDEWTLEFQPYLDECVAIVRQAHENTAYDDKANP